MVSVLKALLMLNLAMYECTNALFNLLKTTINNLNTNYCTICRCKINKSVLHKKLKKIFCLPYKDSLCIDCFIKNYNLEHILDFFESFTICSCGDNVTITKNKYYWIIKCNSCINEIVDPSLNECFIKWEEQCLKL